MDDVEKGWTARRESRPFAWEKLTEAQRAVARDVRSLVAAMTAGEDTNSREKAEELNFARLDPDKRNRVILIEGRASARFLKDFQTTEDARCSRCRMTRASSSA